MSDRHPVWMDFHLHNLIVNGIHLKDESPFYGDLKRPTELRFKRFNFEVGGSFYTTFQNRPEDTPYLLDGDRLYHLGRPLDDLALRRLQGEDDLWGSETNWYFKKSSDAEPFFELRLNPVNACANAKYRTGLNQELRGCAFCARCYPLARTSETRKVVTPQEIFTDMFTTHGPGVIKEIRKALVLTGDTPDEYQMLDMLEEIHRRYLMPYGFRGVFSIATTLFHTEESIKRLSKIDNTLYEFPVECFSRRTLLLGEKKGIPLDEIESIFKTARKYFRHIRIDYVVGLDDYETAIDGFTRLVSQNLIDDIVANVLAPFTPAALTLRDPSANSMYYYLAFRDLLRTLALTPKRTGIRKDLFSGFQREVLADAYCETEPRVRHYDQAMGNLDSHAPV